MSHKITHLVVSLPIELESKLRRYELVLRRMNYGSFTSASDSQFKILSESRVPRAALPAPQHRYRLSDHLRTLLPRCPVVPRFRLEPLFNVSTISQSERILEALVSRTLSIWKSTMGGFFRGWKRKLGVVTLLMTCVLMVGWLRSSRWSDAIAVPRTSLAFGSFEHSLICAKFNASNEDRPLWDTSPLPDQSFFTMPQIEWTILWRGFGIGRSTGQIVSVVAGVSVGTPDYEFVIIPYWAIVPPLTAISAWLLLSESRVPLKPSPNTEGQSQ